ncbi:hypothetical protein [Paraburkholderia sp. BR14312]
MIPTCLARLAYAKQVRLAARRRAAAAVDALTTEETREQMIAMQDLR